MNRTAGWASGYSLFLHTQPHGISYLLAAHSARDSHLTPVSDRNGSAGATTQNSQVCICQHSLPYMPINEDRCTCTHT